MLKIYLARHGQDQDNADGLLNGRRNQPLTAIGEKQAHELAGQIKAAGLIFDAVYASPLQRAFKTAEVISEVIGAPKPVVMESLIERDFGVMTGQPVSTIEEKCSPDIIKTDTITYFLSPDGAETFPDMLGRGQKVLNELRTRHSDGSVLLVTHGDLGKMVYAAYYNLPWQEVLTGFHFGNSELLLLSEDSPATEAHVFKIKQYNH